MIKVKWLLIGFVISMGGMTQADTELTLASTLDSFHQAAAHADIDSYIAAMTDDIVFLGTDGSERWQGQAFRDFARNHFNAGRGWTYSPVARNITIAADGQTAWFDETLHNDSLGLCRGSGVMVEAGGGWKIAQYNLSVPVPNAMVHDVVADIAASESLMASSGNVADDSRPTTPAPSAMAAEVPPVDPNLAPAVPDEPAAATEPADCKRKRFKTNRRAGC